MRTKYTGIVLSGASGGLGRALACEFARPGCALLLLGRDTSRLKAAAEDARARGSIARYASLDIGNHRALNATVADFEARFPIDLVVANAGVKCRNERGIEPFDQVARIVNVNLLGTISIVQAALPYLADRGKGRIAIVSSLSAHAPQADLLSYSATKAAVRAYGIALRRRLRSEGIDVSVIEPGFVDTPMTRRHMGWTPNKLAARDAARLIVRRLERQQSVIGFPYLLWLISRLDGFVPARLSDLLNRSLRAEILPDPDEANSDLWPGRQNAVVGEEITRKGCQNADEKL